MTPNNIASLFGAMLILAAIPSLSVFTVVARAISSGFVCGAMTATGIVLGDIIFIILAIYGLSAIADNTMNSLLLVIKYFGGIYLIWLGIGLIRAKSKLISMEKIKESSLLSGFISGLLITLSDQKAILFYVSFFPAFVDLKNITLVDTLTIIAIAIVAVGGVKLGYAYLADRARSLFQSSRIMKGINLVAAGVMIVVGIFLIGKPL